jgi:3-methyladenine DNA glycosylase AlkD
MVDFAKTVLGRARQELLAISKVNHRYPEVIAQAEKVDWYEDFSSGYKGLYYFIPISLSPNYVRKLRVNVVDVPMVRKVSSKLYQELRTKGIRDIDSILSICKALLQQWTWEYRTIAFDWSFRIRKQFTSHHFRTFEDWTKLYLSTWGSVDDFCTHTMGSFFYVFTEYAHHVKQWASSDNPWIRRAAAVSLIYGLRRGSHIDYIFDVADAMLTDPRKYVQNGYGWMLKEATKYFQDEVFDYVMRNKPIMPRRALRYAIEKMPKTLKSKAMA